MSAIEKLTGALLIEICMAVMLYGMSTIQAYVYWWNYPDDPLTIRSIVGTVWILETTHTAFCLHLIYSYMVKDFGNVQPIEHIVWSAGAAVLVAVFVAAIAQGFFIRRIWVLSRNNRFITCVAATLLFCRVCTGIATSILSWNITEWASFRTSIGPLFTLTFGVSLAATEDMLIAGTLIYYLQKSRTGARRTDHLIRTLQTYIINTGSLTMLVSITIVLTYIFYEGSLLFVGMVTVQGKLYANSFLATLNARQHLTSPRGTAAGDAITMSFAAAKIAAGDRYRVPARHIEIYQTVTKAMHDDAAQGIDVGSSMTETPENVDMGVDGVDGRKGQILV
ncbi:uncharacterized protein LAESUDRAFT_445415 [Laetiporus sulphureus 93-53]|uniref:DUF6534 domain-containing protein n=1 Tax=Laetiporus sulphureus 93-53 TaxID=1314785 RepID=A0A165C120_9APHY|nr:uncharacterized protein LAESUDRAFT_445415 [Laetiporus sulphureus 93-53]KZT02007.1 hypothetical protein LAESUDRAFT_445415 [Laetiporus sulphureus 93-53]